MAPTIDEIRARLQQEVEGWRPEPGDEVLGKVLTVDEREGDYGPYPYIEIDDDITGKLIGVHAFHAVLRKEIANKRPQVGGTLAICYKGKKKTKSGTGEFEHYRVEYYAPEGATQTSPNWDGHAEEADGELHEMGVDVHAAFPGATEEEPF